MRKEHKSKTGGLTKAGRDYFKRTEGANLKAPVKKGAKKSFFCRSFCRYERPNER